MSIELEKSQGRPTKLTPVLLSDIKKAIVRGENDKETAFSCGVPYDTFIHWKLTNYMGFYNFYMDCHGEKLLTKALENIKDIASMDTNEESDPRLIKIKADLSQWIAERTSKSPYKKDTDLKDRPPSVNITVKKYTAPQVKAPVNTEKTDKTTE